MKLTRLTPTFAIVAVMIVGGCHETHNLQGNAPSGPPVQHSAIVAEFESAGGGDPAAADDQGLKMFLGQHPQLSRKIVPLCADSQKTAAASWLQTPEGRVCKAASEIVSFRNFYGLDSQSQTDNADKRTYGPVPNSK